MVLCRGREKLWSSSSSGARSICSRGGAGSDDPMSARVGGRECPKVWGAGVCEWCRAGSGQRGRRQGDLGEGTEAGAATRKSRFVVSLRRSLLAAPPPHHSSSPPRLPWLSFISTAATRPTNAKRSCPCARPRDSKKLAHSPPSSSIVAPRVPDSAARIGIPCAGPSAMLLSGSWASAGLAGAARGRGVAGAARKAVVAIASSRPRRARHVPPLARRVGTAVTVRC